MLFYDTPASPLVDEDLRSKMFRGVKLFLLQTTHEDMQIETVRLVSNLSRHKGMCQAFIEEKTFIQTLALILEHTLRDLVFYTIGIMINITLNDTKCLLEQGVIVKLIDVLKDSNIEDMELAKVAGKALHNIMVNGGKQGWQDQEIKKLDEAASNLGEELDSIMVRII